MWLSGERVLRDRRNSQSVSAEAHGGAKLGKMASVIYCRMSNKQDS